ncbi:hypothetical protein CLAIMM_10661 [Cladophialophora immunda]|nr:hypothetical protein CLAIMM_10661 [Cladophialophora immunda]
MIEHHPVVNAVDQTHRLEESLLLLDFECSRDHLYTSDWKAGRNYIVLDDMLGARLPLMGDVMLHLLIRYKEHEG